MTKEMAAKGIQLELSSNSRDPSSRLHAKGERRWEIKMKISINNMGQEYE